MAESPDLSGDPWNLIRVMPAWLTLCGVDREITMLRVSGVT